MLNGAVSDFVSPPNSWASCGLNQFFCRRCPRDLLGLSGGRSRNDAHRQALSGEALIACGALDSCLDSKVQGNKKLDTPHLKVVYQAPAESHHARF